MDNTPATPATSVESVASVKPVASTTHVSCGPQSELTSATLTTSTTLPKHAATKTTKSTNKTNKTRKLGVFRHSNFDALDLNMIPHHNEFGGWQPCVVCFEHNFVGLGAVHPNWADLDLSVISEVRTSKPWSLLGMPVGQFVQINPSLVVVPFCVLNRCGAVLDPDSVKQHVKLAVNTKTYACPWQPSRAWEGWQFATQLGQY